MPFTDALIIAVSGISVVFLMLCILWLAMILIDKLVSFIESFERVSETNQKIVESEPAKQFAFGEMRDETWDRPIQKVIGMFTPKPVETKPAETKPVETKPAEKAAKASAGEPVQQAAYGGELLLFDVDEKTAACLMAIVCEQTKIPLNELVFKSIRALD
ncbi:MAG: OadG family protein [Solobacterium sp.]|nr:OadG family protein [Solobacterium sp.]